MSNYIVDKSIVIHKDIFAYVAHPSITVINGEWIIVFTHSVRREPRKHPPGDPLFRTLLIRSPDQGTSWRKPYFVPDFNWYGVECPGISTLSDNSIVLTQFRFAWYPFGVAKKKRGLGEAIAISLPGKNWTVDFTEDQWGDAEYPWARGNHGVYVHISKDEGYTFETVKLDMSPYKDGYTRVGVLGLEDGSIAYPLTEHYPFGSTPGRNGNYTYMLRSNDNCNTWTKPVQIVDSTVFDKDYYGEPDIVEVSPGEIFCILRTDDSVGKSGYLYSCRSFDRGDTWTNPEITPMCGLPGHLIVLDDGRLLCTYGRRIEPFGVRAMLSEDGGRTWLSDDEIIIRDDLPNGDLGYPTTIEYEPGCLFVCYYGQDTDGVTCIQGTYVKLC